MSKKLFKCSIYKDRPQVCKDYPFDFPNDDRYFEDCQYLEDGKVTNEPLNKNGTKKTIEEQNQYCMECGMCCHYMTPMRMAHTTGSVWGSKKWWRDNAKPCPMLQITNVSE